MERTRVFDRTTTPRVTLKDDPEMIRLLGLLMRAEDMLCAQAQPEREEHPAFD